MSRQECESKIEEAGVRGLEVAEWVHEVGAVACVVDLCEDEDVVVERNIESWQLGVRKTLVVCYVHMHWGLKWYACCILKSFYF